MKILIKGQRTSPCGLAHQDGDSEGVGVQPRREDRLRRLPQARPRSDLEVHEGRHPAQELRPRLRGHDEAPATLLSQRTFAGQMEG